jgi:outer membrane protein TolC
MRVFLTACALLAGLCGLFTAPVTHAQSLDQLLEQALKKHDRVLKAQADVDKARQEALEALGDWFPELDTTATHGYQAVLNPHSDNTRLPLSELDLKLTQRLWDFGASNAAIDGARLDLIEAKLKLTKVKAKLVREAAGIYVGVEGSNAFLKFSHLLVGAVRDKIKFQRDKHAIENPVEPEPRPTAIENVETPSEFTPKSEEDDQFKLEKDGFDSEVGDSFSLSTHDSPDSVKIWDELTKAQKKEVKDELRVAEFVHGFRTFFGFTPDPDKLSPAPLLLESLPTSVDEAVQQARESNVEIALTKIAESQARKEVKKTRSEEFMPTLDGILQRKWKNNVDGTADLKTDTVAKVELSWSLNLGLTAINTLKAAESEVGSAAHDLADTRLEIEEKVRDAWQKIETNRRIMEITQEQIAIREYLLQQAEEKVSAHSIEGAVDQPSTSLDIINFKKQIYEANRDYVKASYDVHIATYKLLELTGRLNDNIFLRDDTSGIAPDISAGASVIDSNSPTALQKAGTSTTGKNLEINIVPGQGSITAGNPVSNEAKEAGEVFYDTVRELFESQFNAQKTPKLQNQAN